MLEYKGRSTGGPSCRFFNSFPSSSPLPLPLIHFHSSTFTSPVHFHSPVLLHFPGLQSITTLLTAPLSQDPDDRASIEAGGYGYFVSFSLLALSKTTVTHHAPESRRRIPGSFSHRSPNTEVLKVAGISIFSLPLALSKTIVSNHAPQSRHKVPTVSSTETEETTIHYVAIGSEHHEAASSSAVFSIIPTSSMCRRSTPNFDGDRRPCGG